MAHELRHVSGIVQLTQLSYYTAFIVSNDGNVQVEQTIAILVKTDNGVYDAFRCIIVADRNFPQDYMSSDLLASATTVVACLCVQIEVDSVMVSCYKELASLANSTCRYLSAIPLALLDCPVARPSERVARPSSCWILLDDI